MELLYSMKKEVLLLLFTLIKEGAMDKFDNIFKPGSMADEAMNVPGAFMKKYDGKTEVFLPIPYFNGRFTVSAGAFQCDIMAVEETYRRWLRKMGLLKNGIEWKEGLG
jgi:hypothetical protein